MSVALICAVAGMVTSFQATLVNIAITDGGNRHLTIENVSKKDLKYFTNNSHVKSMYLSESFGYAKVDNINKYIASNYEKIFGSGTLKIRYVSTFKNKSEDDLIKRYKDNYQKELSVGKTLEGIHHDDIVFVLDNNNLKEWGSEGQRKNAIISFKLAEINVINEIKGYYPILILDDLFSELDKEKVTNLLGMLDRNVQTFMTTTDLKNISKKVIKDAKKFKVNDGILEEE